MGLGHTQATDKEIQRNNNDMSRYPTSLEVKKIKIKLIILTH